MSIKCLFGHKWNGCKCERCGAKRNTEHKYIPVEGNCMEKCSLCGKPRSIEHKWNGCKCEQCGATRDEGHLIENGKCSICGIKILSIDSFTSDEISMIAVTMAIAQAAGKQFGERDTERHAEALVKTFIRASLTGRGSLTQSDIDFIHRYVTLRSSTFHTSGDRLEAEKHDKLLLKLKLIAPTEQASSMLF